MKIGLSFVAIWVRYSVGMDKDDHLEKHLELCRRVYLRMLADDSWPWKDEADSQKSENLVESKDNKNDV